MDIHQRKDSFSGNTQRRKLVKKQPPSHGGSHHHQQYQHSRSSSGFDRSDSTGKDADSLQSKRSSQSLRRAPSAPPVRQNPAIASPSGPLSPRNLFSSSSFQRPSPSSNLSHDDRGDYGSHSITLPHRGANGSSDPHLDRVAQPSATDDFIGAPFDGDAILKRLDSPTTSNLSPQISIDRHNSPSPLIKAGPERATKPPLRASASFSTMASTLVEKTGGRSPVDVQVPSSANSKRYSDEGRDVKTSGSRRKGGLSSLMNTLVGAPKKPTISAPENPVHVTHVGYDSNTGQFTVSPELLSASAPHQLILLPGTLVVLTYMSRYVGPTQRVAEID
jgi:p21-activated kinase 1